MRDFEVEHERRMHLIVVRRDGRGFQHLHPRLVDGEWRMRMTIPQAGAYRVFADFKRDGEPYTLAADLTVDGAADYRALPQRSRVARTDGYRVELDRADELRFDDHARRPRDHPSPTSAPAATWSRCARAISRSCTCIRPETSFEAELERGTRYRLYLQFQHDGEVHTAEFTR